MEWLDRVGQTNMIEVTQEVIVIHSLHAMLAKCSKDIVYKIQFIKCGTVGGSIIESNLFNFTVTVHGQIRKC
jgi:hypothetical protein